MPKKKNFPDSKYFNHGNHGFRDSSKNGDNESISNDDENSLSDQGSDVMHNADSMFNNLRDGINRYNDIKDTLVSNKHDKPDLSDNERMPESAPEREQAPSFQKYNENPNVSPQAQTPGAGTMSAGGGAEAGGSAAGVSGANGASAAGAGEVAGVGEAAGTGAGAGTGGAAAASAGAGTGGVAAAGAGAGTGGAAAAGTGAAAAGGPVTVVALVIILIILLVVIFFFIIASVFYVFLSSASTTGEEMMVTDEYEDNVTYQTEKDTYISAFNNNLSYIQQASEDALELARQEVKDFAEANGFNVKETIEAYDQNVENNPPFANVNWADPILIYSMGIYGFDFSTYDRDYFINYIQNKEALHYLYYLEFEEILDCEGAYEFKNIDDETEYSDKEKEEGKARTVDTYLKVNIYPYSLTSLYDRIKSENPEFSPYNLMSGSAFTYEECRTIQQTSMSAYLEDKTDAGWEIETPWSRTIHHYDGCPLKDIEGVDNRRLSEWIEEIKNSLDFSRDTSFGTDAEYTYDDNVKREYVNRIPRFYQGKPEAWAGMQFSGSGKTFAQVGCLLTSVSMLVSYFSGEIHTPPDIYNNNKDCWSGASFMAVGYTNLAKRYGYKCVWGYGESERVLTDSYSFTGKYASTSKDNMDIVRHLKEGHTLILELGKPYASGSTHYVVVSGIDKNGKLIVNDPNYSKGDKMDWSIDKVNAALHRVYAFKK